MDTCPLTMRIAGMLLWLLSLAPALSVAAADPPRRQTEFSDRNYQPSRQINTSAPALPATTRIQRPSAERNSQRTHHNTESIKWTSGRGTETLYRVYYEYDNTRITFASVCSNYRKGSIDYRNCRKAAKQWFGERCNTSHSAGRMYCHADNAFRP